ncbi:hypothetical protein KC343_g5864, partial [Hortaea werneckii]
MRVLSFLTAALLPFTALAAKKTPSDRFAEYNTKQRSAGKAISLNDRSYEELTKSPRD